MKNFNQFVNEGIRDKMLPKSEDELQSAYNNLIKDINNPLSTYPYGINREFQEIADLFKLNKKDLHLITEDNDKWNLLDELFTKYTENIENKIIEVKETETEYGGEWVCWSDKKLAYWNSNEINDVNAWIFYKNDFVNESIRDKMSPKSEEDILNSLKGLSTHQKLMLGCKNDSVLAVKLVMEEDEQKKDEEDESIIHIDDEWPLRKACKEGSLEVVKFLLDNGADVHACDDDAFWVARGNRPLIKLLNSYKYKKKN